jgi:hypothetical protein
MLRFSESQHGVIELIIQNELLEKQHTTENTVLYVLLNVKHTLNFLQGSLYVHSFS